MSTEGTSKIRPIVICGPSGSGKSTILTRMFAAHPDTFEFSVSHTTRSPRGKEQHGVEYNFTTQEDFVALIEANGFIEHAQFGGNRYGTSVEAIDKITKSGKIAVLDIEMEGVRQIQEHPSFARTARYLFLSPPSLKILEERLRGRGTDTPEAIEKRLAKAQAELAFGREEGRFDKIVVNDDLEKAYKEVEDWVFKQ